MIRTAGQVVTIERIDGSRPPALGEDCHFSVRGDTFAAVEYFLEHEGVLYPNPLPPGPDHSIRLFPEAPGRYALHAAWHATTGRSGWARLDWHVAGPGGNAPQRVTVDRETLLVPTPWDAHLVRAHEPAVVRELQRLIGAGTTVYDIGANVGVFSARFARWIGPGGWLYAIEPNPVCIYFLRANLEQVAARNFSILPLALSSGWGDCSFTLNYGSSLIGVAGESGVPGKPGHRIAVEARSLDTVIATFHLRQPGFIKVDVEGTEARTVAGMMETLERNRPGLMIELHGREAARATLPQIADLGYEYVVCSTAGRYQNVEAVLADLPDACVQVVASPRP